MKKGKKFPIWSKYEHKNRRRSRIIARNQGTWFDKETGNRPGTHVKRWKKQNRFNKYGRAW